MNRTKLRIGIIDYGMGNLRSVSKAVEHLKAAAYVGDEPKKLSAADKLILPGVGAFGDAMRELEKRKLIDPILKMVSEGKPFLGICLGLQLLFESSDESPRIRGLGIWKGRVVQFRRPKDPEFKIPHMGWNSVAFKKRDFLMQGVANHSYFYFVHSYYADPADKHLVIGNTNYGVSFPSVLASRNVFALQFHPEKSQEAGLRILKNFIHH